MYSNRRRRSRRGPGFLFWFFLFLATALGVVVVVSPLLSLGEKDDLGSRLGFLFGYDDIVRKTAAFSAFGLWFTAMVFFRRSKGRRSSDPDHDDYEDEEYDSYAEEEDRYRRRRRPRRSYYD